MLAALTIAYVLSLLGLSAWAGRGMRSVDDYALAGRRLPLALATPTLLATWFGAGTLLAAADEVRRRGISAATLDPIGAGLCLVLAGIFLARPLVRLRLTTLPDLFRIRMGSSVERVGGLLMVPTYLGWVAAQYVALGELLALIFPIPSSIGIVGVALVGTGYTWLGGMWAVTLTDAAQIVLVTLGLVLMTLSAAHVVPEIASSVPPKHLQMIPPGEFLPWLGILFAGSLGNLPSQDLMQRVFASRSEQVAQRACILAGLAYLVLGALPVYLGLVGAAMDLAPDAVLPQLSDQLLSEPMQLIFLLTVLSAVLSTIDSALLAPATVLSENVLSSLGTARPLTRNRACVALISILSLGLAFSGESAYGLLEATYELTMVALLAPLVFGLRRRVAPNWALTGMLFPSGLWTLFFALGVEELFGIIPVGLACTGLSVGIFALGARPLGTVGQPRHV
ncbi:MAG: sodium:solute symporter family protein [Myxococcota bacterium]